MSRFEEWAELPHHHVVKLRRDNGSEITASSCGGLLFFKDSSNKCFLLNPTFKLLRSLDAKSSVFSVALGYDSKSDDYKMMFDVVCLCGGADQPFGLIDGRLLLLKGISESKEAQSVMLVYDWDTKELNENGHVVQDKDYEYEEIPYEQYKDWNIDGFCVVKEYHPSQNIYVFKHDYKPCMHPLIRKRGYDYGPATCDINFIYIDRLKLK
ncbi:hypothetical protein OROMI_030396 [Orobanche minor]